MGKENQHELKRMLSVNYATGEALREAEKTYTKLEEELEGEEGSGCSIVALVYMFGYENIMFSEEQKYKETRVFFDKFNELVEEGNLSVVIPCSSGEFLNLIDKDDFYGCLIITETGKKRTTETETIYIGHVYAIRPSYQPDGSDDKGDKFIKTFAVLDIGRNGKSSLIDTDTMIDIYTDALLVDGSDGGYTRGIFVLMTSAPYDDLQEY
jgi:hypothetical protein